MPNDHPPQPVAYDLAVGQFAPGTDYKTEKLLGRGGMGSVYQMVRGELEFRVAVKIMHRDLAGRPEFVRMFLEEARILKQVRDHPNLVRILDYAKLSDGTPFIAMELLDGNSLGKVMRASHGQPIDRAAAFQIVHQILEGLFELHSQGIVHRDLKPDNIYLQRRHMAGGDAAVKILDCGLAFNELAAARQERGVFQGTPKYMAPEQIRCEAVSPQTDIYAVALMLCEMLLGTLPFELRTGEVQELMDAHLWLAPLPLSRFLPWISPMADQLVLSALHKDASKRPRSAFDFQSQLFLEADRLRKGLPPEMAVDVNTTTPTPMDFSDIAASGAGAVPTDPVNRTQPLGPPPQLARRSTLRMDIAPTHPGAGNLWQAPAPQPPPPGPGPGATAPSTMAAPVLTHRTPDPRPASSPPLAPQPPTRAPGASHVSQPPPASYGRRPPAHGNVSASPSIASTSETGTTRSVRQQAPAEESPVGVRAEVRRRILVRSTVLVSGFVFSAAVVTAIARFSGRPTEAAAASSSTAGSTVVQGPPASVAAPKVAAALPALAAISSATSSPPSASSNPRAAASAAPSTLPSLDASLRQPVLPVGRVAAPRAAPPPPKPAPVASDGSDELFRPQGGH